MTTRPAVGMVTEGTTSDDNGLTFKQGQKIGQWRICAKVGEGGFGQVYKVESLKDKGRFAALKAESNEVEGGSAIKLEIAILLLLNRKGPKPHFPVVLHSAKRKRYCYMMVTLLGENIRTLKKANPDEKFSISTWSRIGIQSLYGLKLLHDCGFVHRFEAVILKRGCLEQERIRDVKPANFVMGHSQDPDRVRIVHLLDFGLARSFAVEKNGVWIARRARGSAEFRGTVRYCSPSVHEKKEQGRKDDLWSWLYMLIECHCCLPWQFDREKERIETKKLNMTDDVLCRNFPEELHPIPKYLRGLDCYNRPDYTLIHNCLLELIKNNNVKYADKYDWETETSCLSLLKKYSKPHAYENAAEFFALDPVKINEAPLRKKGNTVDDPDALFKAP
ncbi:hypothetical protein L596_020435 [Steinernema carpocapsae]|uniref:Protein kinase domain-containing protein n=1 Tax=Steinernema carpocapsae TaxID=34508 RepID=A0A4U5MTQ6_STECR|nr:hypothetical protein L596_020435 [Steinernema carpocapsae]